MSIDGIAEVVQNMSEARAARNHFQHPLFRGQNGFRS